jgi:nicotinamide mononucleotide (NMN) deamidase PncC
MEQETAAEAVARLLAERGWTLGTIECGTDGIVGHQLFDTEEGPAVLGDSLTMPTVEEAIDFLALPWQQFAKPGEFSVKAARAAARHGRPFLGVDLCLAVWALPPPAEGTTVKETVHLALHTGEGVYDRTLHYKGPKEELGSWLAEQGMQMILQVLT